MHPRRHQTSQLTQYACMLTLAGLWVARLSLGCTSGLHACKTCLQSEMRKSTPGVQARALCFALDIRCHSE
jgi:hypothetical protein